MSNNEKDMTNRSNASSLLFPEELSALVLRYLRTCAERFLHQNVKTAVLTVPAYFTDAQRERTKAAGQIAGLEICRIINEPTAAALAYGLEPHGKQNKEGKPMLKEDEKNKESEILKEDENKKESKILNEDENKKESEISKEDEKNKESKTILVFDLGGGTFDVSVIVLEQGVREVKATAGDTHLGGQDFDSAVVHAWVEEIQQTHDVDLSKNVKAMARLRNVAESAKRTLSYAQSFETEVPGLVGGEDKILRLSRAKFDELNEGLFRKCLVEVERVLKSAKVHEKQVDEVLLVGGSTRIVKIQTLLGEYFKGVVLSQSVNPDEAVAAGAAVQGAILSEAPEQQSEATKDMLLLDVASLSIGVNIDEGRMDVLIPRNSSIPTRVTKEYHTIDDYQTEVLVEIYEGERPRVSQNHLLGNFRLTGIRKAKRGKVDIAVTFAVDANGVLTVTAEEVGGKKQSLVVKNQDRLGVQEIEQMVKNAEERAAEDATLRRVLELRTEVERRLYQARSSLNSLLKHFSSSDPAHEESLKLKEKVGKAFAWLLDKGLDVTLEELERNGTKLDNIESAVERLQSLAKESGKEKRKDSSVHSPHSPEEKKKKREKLKAKYHVAEAPNEESRETPAEDKSTNDQGDEAEEVN